MQPQAQPVEGAADTSSAGAASTADQTQTISQAIAVTSQSQTSQNTVAATPGQDPNQQANSSSQAQAAVPSADQWYQQQQQYQQYYQQYPGYDPYQQHYPNYYQQAAVPQYQQQNMPAHGLQATGQNHPQVYMQPQTQPQTQAPQVSVASQAQNQAQVNPQQQVLPTVPPHSKIQSQTYPPPHSHSNPPPQPYSQAQLEHGQYQQPHPQMQHPQPQVQQQTQSQVQPHHPPSLAQPQGLLQHHPQFHPPQPNQPLNANIQPQAQHQSAHAVTGYHSYPQPQAQPHQQMQAGSTQQFPVHAQPQAVATPQSHNPAQMQSHFPQQPPLMRPPHSHATIPSQQQPALLPSPGQVQNITPPKQQSSHVHPQQPGLPVQQRPVMRPVQQPMPQQYYQQQQPFPQNQLPMMAQLHHPGQVHPFPQQPHAFPQPSLQYSQSQNLVGRPLMPNHGVQLQPYPQFSGAIQARPVHLGTNQPSTDHGNMLKTNTQVQLPSEQQSGGNSRPTMSASQGDQVVVNDLGSAPGLVADMGEVKIDKYETDMKSMDGEHKSKFEENSGQAYASLKKIPQSTEVAKESESQFSENREPMVKPIMKEENEESTVEHSGNGKLSEVVADNKKDVLNMGSKQIEHFVPENKEIMDGSQLKNLAPQVSNLHNDQGGKLQKDAIRGSDEGVQALSTASAQIVGSIAQNVTSVDTVPGNENKQLNQHGLQDKTHPQVPGSIGFVETSHTLPVSDQGRHQLAPSYGSSTLPQRPDAPSLLQAPPPGPPHQPHGVGRPPTYFRPHGPGHVPAQPFHPPGVAQDTGSTATFGRGPSHYGPFQRSFEPQSGAPLGPHNQGNASMLPFGALPPGPFDSRGGIIPRPALGPEGQLSLQHTTNVLDGRRPDRRLPGPLEQGQPSGIDPNMMRLNGTPGYDSSSTHGSRNERFKPFLDERLNPIPPGTDRRVFDRTDFEDDPKKFSGPFPLDAEAARFGNLSSRLYDKKYDAGLKLDPGTGSSRFLSPYHSSDAMQANEVGERPFGAHQDVIGRTESTRGHPDFFGPVSAYDRHHMDGMPPRSPPRGYPGISSRGFRGSAYDDFDGREFHQFGEPVGNVFHDGRFSMLPSHLRRGEFEGPGYMRMGEKLRNDLISQDSLPGHIRRGEHSGPRNLHGSLHLGEPVGYGVHPHHVQMGGMAGPGSFESFGGSNRPSYSRLGEPGFRNSFSRQGFPNDDGTYTVSAYAQNLFELMIIIIFLLSFSRNLV